MSADYAPPPSLLQAIPMIAVSLALMWLASVFPGHH